LAELIRITSEALQATVRRLLPSQQGFGEDLQASNVITPIIDLTPSAEGSELSTDLARASAFGSQTAVFANNNTVTIANTPGFYRFIGAFSVVPNRRAKLSMSDGLTTKDIYGLEGTTGAGTLSETLDFTFFLDTGENCTCVTNDVGCFVVGSVRQVADRYGNVVNPNGFTFE
jgi:hypothetical protein